MFTTVKTRVRSTIDMYHIAKLLVAEAKADAKYESMIAESRAKIGEYKPVPFVPVVIA
jgi:hypothetical protein